MVVPETRFYLRLESGDRVGDKIPISPAGLTVGRRPENILRLSETSVSGKHAELTVDEHGVTVRDLGSTNGTRVSGEKIQEARVAHGDPVVFGNVRFTLLDGTMEEPPAAPEGALDQGVSRVAQEKVASSGRKGFLGLVLILVVVAAAAGVGLQFLGGDGEIAATGGRPVVEVPGNLIADPSFEGVDTPLAWESTDPAAEAFYRDASFRGAGAVGLGVELGAGTWARSRSPEIDLRSRRSHTLRADLGADGGAAACVGVELSSEDGSQAPFVVWTETVRDSDGLETVELTIPSLPLYDRARVVVDAAAASDGSASCDDVSLVANEGDSAPAVEVEEHRVHLLGSPPRTAVVSKAIGVILAGIRVRAGDRGDGLPRWPAATLSAEPSANGIAFRVQGAPAGSELALVVNAAVPFEGEADEGTGWVATMGPEGFRSYSTGFEDVQATGLLLGRGFNLMRIGFAEPVEVDLAVARGAGRVSFALGDLDAFEIQLTFREERNEAAALASTARSAAQRGDPGASLAAWSELLDRYPFEAQLVEEAGEARGRILADGLNEVAAVREEVERARFFKLADLFRLCRERALAVGASYAGSEVETEAKALAAEIDAELADFDAERRAARADRLNAILRVIEGEEWKGLSEHLRGALRDEEGNNRGPTTDG